MIAKARALFLLFIISHCSSGCVGSFRTLPGDTSLVHTSACQRLDQKHIIGGTVAQIGILGATALSGIAASVAKDHPDTAMKFGIGATASGALGAVGTYYSNSYASDYAAMCGVVDAPKK